MRKKYWTVDSILKKNATYNMVIGGRNLGKSYAIKSYCLRNSWKDKKVTFILVRRFDLECKPSMIEQYFADTPVTEITGGAYNCITAKAGTLYFSNYNLDDGKVKTGIPCGKYVALSGAVHVKSQAFPDVTDFIFEEFCATEYLSENEPDMMQQLCSTVFRSRHGRVWLIGNTVNRMNPYVKKYDLHSLAKMEQGQIDTYDFNTTDENGDSTTVRIAVEYCSSEGARNGMFFGHVAKNINGGAWECNEHPRLSMPKECYTELYDVLISWINFKFVVALLSNDETGKLLLYGYPYTGKKEYIRKLTTEYSEDLFTTVWFDKNNEIEYKMLELLDQSQIAFSDNLTGDECIQALKGLKSHVL